MSFEKGHKKKGGRTKGTPNKTTQELRQNIQLLIEHNTPKVQSWLDEVSKDNPSKALDFYIKLNDFVLPKLKSIQVKDISEERGWFDMPITSWAND